jgi:hypothetical protein
MVEYANRKSDLVESAVFSAVWDSAGSTPVSTTLFDDRVVQRLRRLHDTQDDHRCAAVPEVRFLPRSLAKGFRLWTLGIRKNDGWS